MQGSGVEGGRDDARAAERKERGGRGREGRGVGLISLSTETQRRTDRTGGCTDNRLFVLFKNILEFLL